MHKQRVLVTGASTGIGKAIASLLYQNGYDVIGTSRNPEVLQDKISGIRYYPLDLQDPLSIDALVKKIGDIDILVNNAGQSQIGPLEEVPMEKVRFLFEVNLFGIIQLIKGIIPSMRARRTGTIINISSMSGIFGVGFTSVYCGTKFALEGISRSLRQEVRSFGIKVILVEPGYIHTTLSQDPNYQTDSEYYEAVKIFKGIREHNINTGATPEAVAKKILDILRKKNPKPAYPVGGDAPRNAFLVRVLPIRIVEWFQRKKFKN
ncbi:MAG: SDR family oxidoreductase [Candidatus Marinimicrobia bacterium]|nr:SDR family oxidoreductase [Candidatus Neomarinimicrobiota bacterium]